MSTGARSDNGRLPVVLDEAHVVPLEVDSDRLQRSPVLVEDVLGRRLEDDLVLPELLKAKRVLAVAPVHRADRRLDVRGPPRARAEAAEERGRIQRAGAELGVVGLHQDAAALGPVVLERADHVLVAERHF